MSTSVGGARTAAPSRWTLALAGVVAGAAGVALSQAAASALRASSSPVEAVAATVRDFTPGSVALFLIHLVGSADKPLLLGGTALVLLAICGYAASWMRRFPLLPDLVFFGLAAVGLLAVLREPRPGLGSSLALVIGFITWIVTLRLLAAPLLALGLAALLAFISSRAHQRRTSCRPRRAAYDDAGSCSVRPGSSPGSPCSVSRGASPEAGAARWNGPASCFGCR